LLLHGQWRLSALWLPIPHQQLTTRSLFKSKNERIHRAQR
jgi:hypothetical protein